MGLTGRKRTRTYKVQRQNIKGKEKNDIGDKDY